MIKRGDAAPSQEYMLALAKYYRSLLEMSVVVERLTGDGGLDRKQEIARVDECLGLLKWD